ncbi:MAG: hypothetical protein ACU833_14205 [Gammaproteobacteria bacterium]
MTQYRNQQKKVAESIPYGLVPPTRFSLRMLRSCALLALFSPLLVSAHRVPENQIDPCKIQVGYEQIHITAYVPTVYRAKQFCGSIPKPAATQLVFDYIGKKLRNHTLEFEVTKEPEGTRVFYREPTTNITGTMTAPIDFNRFGSGNYRVRITILHKGKRLDSYLPLQVGADSGFSGGLFKFFLFLALLAGAYYFIKHKGLLDRYLTHDRNKR